MPRECYRCLLLPLLRTGAAEATAAAAAAAAAAVTLWMADLYYSQGWGELTERRPWTIDSRIHTLLSTVHNPIVYG